MARVSTKEAAEAVLRELPSVMGAFVREDIYGHPREVHVLVQAGPNARHLAYDIRSLLEERLGVPVDQRVISIAQLAPGRAPGPLLAERLGMAPPIAEDSDTAESTAAEPQPEPEPEAEPPAEARVRFTGITIDSSDNRVRVAVTLDLDDVEHRAEVIGLDTAPARLRAAATATLNAIDAICVGRARFEVEHASLQRAFERDYVLVTILVSSPLIGRKPQALVGAHPVEVDVESAAALAALKAVNRTLSWVLGLSDDEHPVSPRRSTRR